VTDTDVIIVGAGFGGIAAAIELLNHGVEEITILEAGEGVGGTWMWNTYPGVACDVPSHLYSYSFAQRRDWSRLCSPGEEILRYLRRVADEHGVTPLVRSGQQVNSCTFDEAGGRWSVITASGESYSAGAVVIATGQLNTPVVPAFDGLDDFAGTAFHSARWDHETQLANKDIAVVGTGASVVQIVPELAKIARSVTVYQRTANWMMPRRNREYPTPVAFAITRLPGVQAARRQFVRQYTEFLTQAIRHPRTLGRFVGAISAAFMRFQLRGDDSLREKVWPDYTFGCKRVLFSSTWLPALRQPHVELVTDPIARVTAEGVEVIGGTERKADVIVWGTGFATTDFMLPMQVVGRDGRSLEEEWSGGPHAHLGMTVPGFPSLFLMYGPNTNTSGGSILVYLEAQAAYIRQAILAARAAGGTIEVRREVERTSDEALQARFAGTAWLDCDSWYRTESGRIVTNWPDSMRSYVARTKRLDAAEYDLQRSTDADTREPAAAAE
jgi:cation diffusion facilitator CzcD-associated flavoprotein CzcO